MVAEAHRNPPPPASVTASVGAKSTTDGKKEEVPSLAVLRSLFYGPRVDKRKVENLITAMTPKTLLQESYAVPSKKDKDRSKDKRRHKVEPWQHRALLRANSKLMILEGDSEEEIQSWVDAIRSCQESLDQEKLLPLRYPSSLLHNCLNFTSMTTKFRVNILGLKNCTPKWYVGTWIFSIFLTLPCTIEIYSY